MPYIKSKDGYNIFYNYANLNSKKPVLFFVHGWLVNWTCFRKEINHFKRKGYPVVYIDMRGHGKSDIPKNKEDYHLERVVDDIKRILDIHNIKKINLIGHSMGGMINLLFTVAYPTTVQKLVLLDSSYKGPDYFKLPNGLRTNILKEVHKNIFLHHVVEHLKTTKKHKKELNISKKMPLYILGGEILLSSSIPTFLYFLDDMYELRIKNKLKKIKQPTLLLASGHDEFFSTSAEKEMNKLLPNSSLSFMFGDHANIITRAKAFSRKIEEFIKLK